MTMIEVVFEQLSLSLNDDRSCVWTTLIKSCLNDDDRSLCLNNFLLFFFSFFFFFFYAMTLLVMTMLRYTHDLKSRYWIVFRLTIFFFFGSCLNDDDNSCVWINLDLVDFGGCVLTTLMVMTMSAMYEQPLIRNFNGRDSWDVSQE